MNEAEPSTTETNKTNLEVPVNNYLILSNPKRGIFNNYKHIKNMGNKSLILPIPI